MRDGLVKNTEQNTGMLLADLDSAVLHSLGPMALAVGLGMAALYVLLPRPKMMPRLLGAALGAAALVAGAAWLTTLGGSRVESILFYSFSGMAILSGAVMITQRIPARAALAFAIVVLSMCGLFLLNAAPFLMAGTIIVYAGAIIVTFLFVIMLAQPEGYSDADARSREPLLAVIGGFFLLCTLLFVVRQTYDTADLDGVLVKVEAARTQTSAEAVRQVLGDPKDFEDQVERGLARLIDRSAAKTSAQSAFDALVASLNKDDINLLHKRLDELHEAGLQARLAVGRLQPAEPTKLSPFAGTPANRAPQPMSAENVAGLGRALFSDYLLAVELGGTLLLVATIGAIAITHRAGAGRRAAL